MFFNPMRYLRNAIHSAKAGDFADAERILTKALGKMPPAIQCQGRKAEERFLLLALLSDIIRKDTGNAEKELALLGECASLAKQVPPPPPGPDHLVNQVYMVHLNRGNAAGRVSDFVLAEQAYAAAFEAARDPEARCKCLAYQGWAIIRQGDKTKLTQARKCFDRFDKICETDSISPFLVAYAWLGRAVLHLYENDLPRARRACEKSIEVSPASGRTEQLLKLLRQPGVTAGEGIRFVLESSDEAAPDVASKQPLQPLPKGI